MGPTHAPKILFIFPRWPARSLWGHFRYKFPALGILTIAGATPSRYSMQFIDENLEEVDFSSDASLVAISVMTPLAARSYEIADRFRALGKTVVLGGIHVSVVPEEASLHADSIVIGEGERSWRLLLEDYEHGALKPVYSDGGFIDLSDTPQARRDLLRCDDYITKSTIQLTRGCPYNCEYCSVTAFFGTKFRSRHLDRFIAEFNELTSKFVFIVDDNILCKRELAKQLCLELRGSGKWWGSQVPITVGDDAEMLKLLAQSGCKSLFIGFESLSQGNLKQMGKNFVHADKHAQRIKRIQDYGIGIQGSFILGCDEDGPGCFDELYEFIIRTRLNAFLISVLTPFPGTRLTSRLEAEGRVLSKDWNLYDMNTVVFQPKNFSPDELQRRYNDLNQALYSLSSILRRTIRPRSNMLIFVPQNFGFRQAWYNLQAYHAASAVK